MSSPIHKFLFSPPPSPPMRAVDSDPNRPFTPLQTLFPPEFVTRTSLDAPVELKSRSPRTPQQSQFTLDNTYPSSYPSPYPRTPTYVQGGDSSSAFVTPRALATTPRASASPRAPVIPPSTPRWSQNEKLLSSPTKVSANVPSSPTSIPSTLPRPLLRLLLLILLVGSSALLLFFVPAARFPSLRAASISQRLTLDLDGRAVVDVLDPFHSYAEARDRDYVPPQVRISRLRRRLVEAGTEKPSAAPPPKTARPLAHPHPLPSSHELLALQSFLLESPYNVLPASLDTQVPLDANTVLGVGSMRIGRVGSDAERMWLEELERQHATDVVIWYGADGSRRPPHYLLDILAEIHASGRHPTVIPCHSRSDRRLLRAILARLHVDFDDSPLLMIGNEAIVATPEATAELRESGELAAMLRRIGWVRDAGDNEIVKPKGRKLKQAKWTKRERTPVEEALAA